MKVETLKPGWYFSVSWKTLNIRASFECVSTLPIYAAILSEKELEAFKSTPNDMSPFPDKPALRTSSSRRVDGKVYLVFDHKQTKIKGINLPPEDAIIAWEADISQ